MQKKSVYGSIAILAAILTSSFSGCATPDAELGEARDEPAFRGPETVENLLATDIRKTDPLTPEEALHTFHLPEGFEVQLFAAEPDIGKPMNIAFDARGRLWVTQTREYPIAAEDNTGQDRVTILEDTNHDGKADKFTVFAEGLNIPVGVMPVQGGAIAFSIPYVYRYFDLDGDDRADQRVVLFGKFGFRDTHGMVSAFTRGFDGWVYACHGFNNVSTARGADGSAITMDSGNTFRFTLDGSRVEQFTYGQVNPFGLTFDPLGNLYSVDSHTQPVYQLQRGGQYPHFTRLPTGLGFGPKMIDHAHGSTAIAGIVYYSANQFPEAFQDNVLTGDVVTNRLYRDRVTMRGSTPVADHRSDFLVSDDPWFRPVDLELGPDGAIYVADFYNRIIGHYEVPLQHPDRDRTRGRIWRVTYRDGVRKASRNASRGNWQEASIGQLIEDLGHPNLTVRRISADQLADRWQHEAVGPVKAMLQDENSSAAQRVQGLWILHRLGHLQTAQLAAAVADSNRSIRVHAMRILAQQSPPYGDAERQLALEGLKDPDALTQRLAAEAVGADPHAPSVRPLLQLASKVGEEDSHLGYVTAMALRDQLRDGEVLKYVLEERWSHDEESSLIRALVGVRSALAARFLFRRIQRSGDEPAVEPAQMKHIARYLVEEDFDGLVKWGRNKAWVSVEVEHSAFRSLLRGARGREDEAGSLLHPWGRNLVQRLMAYPDDKSRGQGAVLAGSLRWRRVAPELVRIFTSDGESVGFRLDAAQALTAIDKTLYSPLLARAVRESSRLPLLRNGILEVLLGVDSSAAVQQELVELIPVLPRRYQRLTADRLARTPEGIRILFTAVERKKFAPTVLLSSTRVAMQSVHWPDLKERYEKLTAGVEPEDERRQATIDGLVEVVDLEIASPRVGWEVFQEHCLRCHQISGRGKTIGPQLDGISERGVTRLLEDLIDPSRNVAEGFKTQLIRLKNGVIYMGFPAEEDAESVLLMDDLENEVRILRSNIETMRPVDESPMPSDFTELLAANEINDLMGFLMAPSEGMED